MSLFQANLAYDFNILSGAYHQPFYVNVFLGPVAPQIRWEDVRNQSSFVTSKLVTPILPGMQRPPTSADTADELGVEDQTQGIDSSHRLHSRDFKEPLDSAWLASATGEVITITDKVKEAMQKAGNTDAEQYLAANLAWGFYGAEDQQYIDLEKAPIKVWATELTTTGPIVVPKLLFSAVKGKPGALKQGESKAIEEFFTQDFALPEPDDD